MPNLSNVNITITATDNTGSGVASAIRNVGSLSSAFSSVGKIGAGVFSGILGANIFSGVSRGIGSVIGAAFGLNNRLKESELASKSMIDTISETEKVGTGAFGKLSKAAQDYEKTLREINEREKDGLDDYASKVDDIKNSILEAQQAIVDSKQKSLDQEKRQLDDLNTSYKQSIRDLNQSIENAEYDHTERLYDLNRQKTDKLANLDEERTKDTAGINKKISDLQDVLSTTTNQIVIDEINLRIGLYQTQLSEITAVYDAQSAKITSEAEHEVQVEKDKYDRKIAALRQQISDENAQYDTRKARIESDTKQEIADAKAASDKKVANLNDQLTKEAELHKRFIRDIKEAYADAQTQLQTSSASSGGGSATGATRTIKYKFDFGDSFRNMDGGEIDKFLADVQQKYVEIGVKSPFNVADIQQFGKSVIQYTGGSADNMEKMVNIAQSLAAKNPMQGMLGATMSMVELLGSGNITSLARRFDLPKAAFEGLSEAKNATEFIDMLGEALKRNGVTLGLVEAKTHTLSGAWDNIKETFNLVNASIMQPVWQWLTDKLVALNDWLYTNRDSLKAFTQDVGEKLYNAFKTIVDVGSNVIKFYKDHKLEIDAAITALTVLLIPAIVKMGIEAGISATIGLAQSIAGLISFTAEGWKAVGMLLVKIVQLGIASAAFVLHAAKTVILTVATGAATAATWLFNAAMAVLTSPIFLVIAAIAALIVIGYLIIKNWDEIKKAAGVAWDWIKDKVVGVWGGIKDAVKEGINWVIDKLNGFISGANKIHGKIGDFEIGINIPQIPKLAAGGIAMSPTLAMIGEAGPEAVVPLNGKHSLGGGGLTVNVYGNYILNDEDVSDFADLISRNLTNKLGLQGAYL